jgi:hypothetical protein
MSKCQYCESPDRYGLLQAEEMLVERDWHVVPRVYNEAGQLLPQPTEMVRGHRAKVTISAIPEFFVICKG